MRYRAVATAARGPRRLGISRLKRRSSTSRIMPKSSPGVSSAERMLNLRYWFFWKPSWPGDDHGADGVRALDVAVVVDLDAARHARQPESLGQRLQQLLLRRGVGELAAQRLARVDQRVRHQLLLLAALRHGDFDLAAGLGARAPRPAVRAPECRATAGCSAGTACRRRTAPGTRPAPRPARAYRSALGK